MAQFLTGLGSALGMNGPGGIAGGLGNMFGQTLGIGPGSQGGAGMPALPNFSATQGPSSYNDPFKPVNGTTTQAAPPAPTLVNPTTQNKGQPSNYNYDNWLLQNATPATPSGATAINNGYASGNVYY